MSRAAKALTAAIALVALLGLSAPQVAPGSSTAGGAIGCCKTY